MRNVKYSVGTRLQLIYGTTTWGQEHVKGRANLAYEVIEVVDDGTPLDRITLRAEGESEPYFLGILSHLFEPYTGGAKRP